MNSGPTKISRLGPNEQYDAMLVDIKDQLSSYNRQTIEASNDYEAISKAHEWAMAECQKIGKKARLIVVGGTILGSHSAVIDPA
jgi:hypothetical protein